MLDIFNPMNQTVNPKGAIVNIPAVVVLFVFLLLIESLRAWIVGFIEPWDSLLYDDTHKTIP